MNTNLTEILKSIPDFEDFMKLGEAIGELSLSKMQLENKIKAMESETFRQAMAQIQPNGKVQSVSYVTNAYLHTGMNGEILEIREQLAHVSSMLDKRKIQLSVYRDMIEVWRTMSSNARATQL